MTKSNVQIHQCDPGERESLALAGYNPARMAEEERRAAAADRRLRARNAPSVNRNNPRHKGNE